MIFGSTSANFGQMEIIFRKIYFPQLPNAWVLRKMISGNDFQPIQTQPKFQWTLEEDDKLVECLLELAGDVKWKEDNGFKPDFTSKLEELKCQTIVLMILSQFIVYILFFYYLFRGRQKKEKKKKT